jgi:hypothetical protein
VSEGSENHLKDVLQGAIGFGNLVRNPRGYWKLLKISIIYQRVPNTLSHVPEYNEYLVEQSPEGIR